MNKKTIITTLLALVTMAGLAQTKTAESKADSLLLLVQAGDSCMQQYNTFEALKYYQEAYAIAKPRSQYCTVQMKLANCHYKRGNYRETANLLKLVPEDSLSHDAFRYASAIRNRATTTPLSTGQVRWFTSILWMAR